MNNPLTLSFDNSVNLGQIIELLAFMSTIFVSFFSLKNSVDRIAVIEASHHEANSKRLDEMEIELRKQTDILVTLAAQREQLQALMARVTLLEARERLTNDANRYRSEP